VERLADRTVKMCAWKHEFPEMLRLDVSVVTLWGEYSSDI
jgi:hypothetical protein